MSQKVTLGGDRVGSGKKMQAELHDYYRSTHNLSERFTSSMASGILYPCLCKLAMRGDTFDIDINADARTIPTVAPLFGSYKMQIDVYQAPVRLYQGILHNNPLAIGLNMSQVKFPTLKVMTTSHPDDSENGGKFSESCLLTYLGMRGLGLMANRQSKGTYGRIINALPALSYYDIFKTYYANKQEVNAYVITPKDIDFENYKFTGTIQGTQYNFSNENNRIELVSAPNNLWLTIKVNGLSSEKHDTANHFEDFMQNNVLVNGGLIINDFSTQTIKNDYENCIYSVILEDYNETCEENNLDPLILTIRIQGKSKLTTSDIQLTPFNLSNIDDMRYDLLGHHELGTSYTIDKDAELPPFLPYAALVAVDETTEYTWNTFALNGLVVKTYQNDMFNNWLNSEWIEGENGINEMTKVAVVDGAFSMDALNMSMKLYNMLNRIALAGNTYEDWQDVVYEEVQRRQIESPIYVGGMSQEIVFDEIVQTTPTDGSPLGTLGGRGRLNGNKKGGRIHVKCDEACFIMAIVSLTPRINYTQGNEFYMTDVYSMDDLHKPAMDGIGFQDLIGERLAYFDTIVTANSTNVIHRSKIGKLPAWIEYMTSYDKAYGDFAGEYGKSFMTLNRNYERTNVGAIKDATTYIDPTKYNYSFAVKDLYAQNFWVAIKFDIKARRLMSARLIPNV